MGEVVRLRASLDTIIPPGARIDKVADRFRAVEGPVWVPEGYLLFSDFGANAIYRWSSDDGVSLFRPKSGYAGVDIREYPLPGSNGLALDAEGRLTVTEHGRRRVIRVEESGAVTVLAERYDGRRLNSPNDLIYKSDGALYFTDPPFGLPARHADPRRELAFSGIFALAAGRLQLLNADLTGPNGLAFSPDERHLYVMNSDDARSAVMRYDVNADGTLGRGHVFFTGRGARRRGEGGPTGQPLRGRTDRRLDRLTGGTASWNAQAAGICEQPRLGRSRPTDPLHHRQDGTVPRSAPGCRRRTVKPYRPTTAT